MPLHHQWSPLNGLTDSRMRTTLSAMHFTKCSHLLRSMQGMSLNNSQSNNIVDQNQVGKRTENYFKQNNEKSQSKTEAEVIKQSHGPICFNWRQRGHISLNCPKKKENVNVVKIAQQEDQVEELEEQPLLKITKALQQRELIKSVRIEGCNVVKCEALIDSGSSTTIIKRSVADRSGLEKVQCCEKLIGFAGGEIICKHKIKGKICFEKVGYGADLLIVDDDMLNHVIISIDVLSKGKVVIETGVCKVLPVGYVHLDIEASASEYAVNELEEILQTYSHCFGEKLNELGKSKNFKINISLTKIEKFGCRGHQCSEFARVCY